MKHEINVKNKSWEENKMEAMIWILQSSLQKKKKTITQ